MVVPNSSQKEQTLKLIAEKDKIERQIAEFGSILEQNNVNMTESLTDDEGFPRNDIDVYQVRHARHQIVCLQNDLKALLKQIEKGLEEVHAEAAAQKSNLSPKTAGLVVGNDDDNAHCSQHNLLPFVKINMVSPGSPAEDAGLMVDDEIIEFGSINSKNFENLGTIAEVVQHKENQKIHVKVMRKNNTMEVNLIPRKWNGRGLLGCNIVLCESTSR